MTHINPMPRNPRYLSIPTLLLALVFAHAVHVVCEPLGLNPFMCTVIYLVGLAIPIGFKRALTFETYADTGPFNSGNIARLPTCRFSTPSGQNPID